MKTLQDLFIHHLKDIYHAEKQILRALPKMAKNSTTPELKQAFEHHREETIGQVERLEKVFEMLDRRARGEPCEAIQGLIAEAEEVLEDFTDPEARDAGLAAAGQAVEHYEIARYGTLCRWAELLGQKQAASLLKETLAEEEATDLDLTKISETSNKAALKAA